MYREEFPAITDNKIHFDNASTTYKPKVVIDSILDYLNNYTANSGRASYTDGIRVDKEIASTRLKVANFINCKARELIFSSGTTDSLNMIVFSFFKYHLNSNSVVVLTKLEHSSNILPWYFLQKEIGFTIKFAKLNDDYSIDLDDLATYPFDVISIASATNTIGDSRDLDKIRDIKNKNNAYLVVDAAQSIAHNKIDVSKYDIDFLAFSSHKVYGLTGAGVMYAKENLLKEFIPYRIGGGSVLEIDSNGHYLLKDIPYCLESGTLDIAAIISLGKALDFIDSIGIDKINSYENDLKKYAVSKLKDNKRLTIYNSNTSGNTVLFSADNIFSEDLAIFLSDNNIQVRSGDHCAKLLNEVIDATNTVRVSFALYNTYSEIDKLVNVLDNLDHVYDNLVL